MRRILSITQRKDIHSEILSSCLITDILTRILIENDTENLSLGFMPAYLKTVLKEIDQHFQEPLSLESLAITAGVSKYHLAHEFKKYLGMPPNEYLIVTRLNHSKTLLKYEDLTIEEIAYSCGFHQVSHYINLFKKHEGCTPLKFRREWHSNEAIKPPDAQ
ncbi:helix-turn-helix transcriptional regulator [Blautia glucerasea]|uniref:helix-turn-helix transcriptional regulator n=1 Tax=Blautia glucerasea TaxID=536633 RepID=UPI001D06EBA7|nr:helix-turn-helix transcriptional regulator [Blautia glucerasea]MCB6545144.1 helix-turn-helix transcriptional regulator [Blautia glucerasea]